MIAFNDSNIYVGQIKELLSSFWLPTCAIVPTGETDYAGYGVFPGDVFIQGWALRKLGEDAKTSEVLGPYKPGDRVFNMSKRLEIRDNYYDSYTHAYLGDYLRYVRDMRGVDLMSMYNCFTWDMPKYITNLAAGDSVFSSNGESYDLYMLPVKPNRRYTIAIDWHGTIEMCACIYDSRLLQGGRIPSTFAKATYASYSGMRFSRPVLYEGALLDEGTQRAIRRWRDKVKLLIKVPKGCESSIVVLEGDWRDSASSYQNLKAVANSKTKVVPITFKDKDGDAKSYSGYTYASKSQLLSVNDGGRNQLADRLVEYLSENVVCPLDPIDRNIAKLQAKYKIEGRIESVGHYGIWDDSLRRATWAYEVKSGMLDSKYDLLGYYDKDAESKIGGLRFAGGEED